MKFSKNAKKANISIMVAVFCLSMFAFCGFGIDMAFITMYRIKLQRATENAALMCARNCTSETDNCENAFRYFTTNADVLANARIIASECKLSGTQFKASIQTQMPAPLYFLRFAGEGMVTIRANSYAMTSEQTIENEPLGKILSLRERLMDRAGNEFKLQTTGNYKNGFFVFAGIKDANDNYSWTDIGCKADIAATLTTVGGSEYNLICGDEINFDLGKDCGDGTVLNSAEYIKILGGDFGECMSPEEKANAITAAQNQIANKINEEAANNSDWENSIVTKDSENNDLAADEIEMPDVPEFPSEEINADKINEFLNAPRHPYKLSGLKDVKLISRENFLR